MAKRFISLKKEIKTINDIRETVKTLEKIAAASIHRLKVVSQNMRSYELLLEKVLSNTEEDIPSYLLSNTSPVGKHLDLVITTEKGLCGALLNNLADFVELNHKKEDDLMVIGSEGKRLLEERMIRIKFFFPSWNGVPKEDNVRAIRDLLFSYFLSKKYREILIFYSEFESIGVQKPAFFIFLPFDIRKFKEKQRETSAFSSGFPIYEPNEVRIKNYLVRKYIGLVFYQKILEAKLSELSARTVAMEEAAEKTKRLLSSLSRQYFREKMKAITKEMSDLYSHRRYSV